MWGCLQSFCGCAVLLGHAPQTALLNGLSVLSLETPLYPGLVASSLTQVRWEGSGGPSTAVVIGLHGAGESLVLGEQFFNLLACAQTLAAAVAV